MVALAVLTVAASAAFLSIDGMLNYAGHLSYLPIQSNFSFNIIDGIVFTVIISIGAILSYLVYYKNSIKSSEKSLDKLIYTAPIVNAFYNLVMLVTYGLSSGISEFDSRLSDTFDKLGMMTLRSGYGIRKASVGSINSYTVIFIVSILVLLVSFYYLVVV